MDHYELLGLSSDESIDCTKLGTAEIKAAYRKKALELHPDTVSRKRKRDGNNNSDNGTDVADGTNAVNSMTAAFQQLQASYEVLMDNEARKKFDVLWLQQKQEKLRSVRERDQWMRMERDWQEEVKREKERWMMRKAPEWKDPVRWGKEQKIGREWYGKVKKEKERQKKLEREWEEDVRREKERQMRMKREAEELRMKMERERQEVEKKDMEAIKKIEEEEKLVYDKLLEEANNEEDVRILEEIWMIRSKILKVIWNKTVFEDFTVRQIKDLFDCFGEVKEVRIKKRSKKGKAFVIMASRESVLAATVTKFANHGESPFFVRPLTLYLY